MAEKYSFGWSRSPQDRRDRFVYASPPRGAYPASFALPIQRVPNLDQGSLGSCGPNTAVEAMLFDDVAQGLPQTQDSRLFVYWCSRYLMGTTNQDSGVQNRAILKALNQFGCPLEPSWPYDVSKYRLKPSQTAFDEASRNKIVDYAKVTQSLTQMKGILYGTDGTDGRPFIFGFEVFQQILSDEAALTGKVVMPSPNENPIGGHDVLLYGWDDAAGVFLFRNHWKRSDGEWWGKQGNGSIPFGYATDPRYADDFWAITKVPGGVMPKPPIPPVPSPVDLTVTITETGTYQLTKVG